jgi:hypothetical protein
MANIIDTLKRDWASTDFYNAADLDRVEKATRHINERIFDYRGTKLDLNLPVNLMPYDNDVGHFKAWYNNLTFSAMTFSTGRTGLRAEMSNFALDARMMVVAESFVGDSTNITQGKTYTYSVIFQVPPQLIIVQYLGMYYYRNISPTFWQYFPDVAVSSLKKESEVDNTYRYETTFVAQATAGARPSFGFGLANPQMANGVGVNILEFRIEEARSESHIEFADSLNKIENNIAKLRTYFYNPKGTISPKTNWVYNDPFDYNDANRLEQNLYLMNNYFISNVKNIPYCGQYTAGQQGVY